MPESRAKYVDACWCGSQWCRSGWPEDAPLPRDLPDPLRFLAEQPGVAG